MCFVYMRLLMLTRVNIARLCCGGGGGLFAEVLERTMNVRALALVSKSFGNIYTYYV